MLETEFYPVFTKQHCKKRVIITKVVLIIEHGEK